MARTSRDRRAIITGLGAAAAAAGAVGLSSSLQAQTSSESFTPTLHREDAWMSAMGGKHRVIMDVTLFNQMPDAIRFAGNILAGHKAGWGVEESDVALLVCLRHQATPYGYTDAIWS